MRLGRIIHLGKDVSGRITLWYRRKLTVLEQIRYIGYAYWAIILACGAVHQLWSYAFHPRKFHEEPSLESQVYPQPSIRHALPWVEPTFRWVQTHLIVPAPFATQGRTLIGLTFSNRAESVVVAGFWLLSIILSLVGYRTFPGNI